MLDTCKNNELNKHLATWLCCASESVCTDYYLCRHCTNYVVLEVNTFNQTYFSGLNRHINPDRTQKAIHKLTPDQRTVVYLKIVKGLSNDKVAKTLSKSIGAVKAIQNQALTTLSYLLLLE